MEDELKKNAEDFSKNRLRSGKIIAPGTIIGEQREKVLKEIFNSELLNNTEKEILTFVISTHSNINSNRIIYVLDSIQNGTFNKEYFLDRYTKIELINKEELDKTITHIKELIADKKLDFIEYL